eukprot:CAMPEP_0168753292 /NCGR_PEP_ID=MMETSP0724-20121128/18856_1 /TAXON_ID=265536 /ORGANISM="Amphiprora sp., Strain CCMP467" /LENGTH=387 /DNA_ID=CAMNT_0008801627 /DNA_START=18 /DNA_END=1181 /DNA_ORIENTATION=-
MTALLRPPPSPRHGGSSSTMSWCCRFLIIIAVLAVAWMALQQHQHHETETKHDAHEDHVLQRYHDPFSHDDRCTEDDDNAQPPQEQEAAQSVVTEKKCHCPDPLVPLPRPDDQPEWQVHHQAQAQQVLEIATETTNNANNNNHPLDVVFLGDSITERWRGTRSMGGEPVPEIRQVFDQYFGADADGSSNNNHTSTTQLRGLALATSGDITVETAWHLDHGWWPTTNEPETMAHNFHPKVVVLLIGTNDLGRSGCSKRNVLVGILHVAEHLHQLQPNIPILFHGLLPRAGGPNDDDNEDTNVNLQLGPFWDQIMWINRELRHLCKNHRHWYYMDSAKLFLERNPENGELKIRPELLPDGLHPSLQGYQEWAPRLSQVVRRIMKHQLPG